MSSLSQLQTTGGEQQKRSSESTHRWKSAKKSYAEIVRQPQCYQYKNNNSTKSPLETKNHLHQKKKNNTNNIRNHIIVSTGIRNNSRNQNNKISSPRKNNIQQPYSTIKNHINLRHQETYLRNESIQTKNTYR